MAEVAERVRTSSDGIRARWVRFEGLHLTLRFLGPTPPEAISALVEATDEIAGRRRPISVRLGGGGAFPGLARPRTLWIGVPGGVEDLAELAAALSSDPRIAPLLPEAATGPRGGPEKPYSPHLTIARTDGVRGAGALARALVASAAGLDVRFTADRVVLYRSHLGGGPAWYEAVHEARLGG